MTDEEERPPLPGRAVRGSATGRPVMAALDLLSRRWTLRILWELGKKAHGFRELQAACDRLSPNTLSTRLSELQTAGLVTRDGEGAWTLTPLGERLRPTLLALWQWSEEWAAALDAKDP